MLKNLRDWWCSLRYGHTFIMQHDEVSQWLECVSCLHVTPGWDRRPDHGLMRSLRFQARLHAERREYQARLRRELSQ